MAENVLLVVSTFGTADEARQAARVLVEERLVACANLLPGIESIYRWKGEVEVSAEIMVLFKTVTDNFDQLEKRLRELHSYEVPEIVAFRVDNGLPAYLRWVDESCLPAR
ncbi:MAG: divalent-cation tolerance protein CutA [Verrucomicrobiaceae bacterium]|nr:MAG: divalent-cation tolerance protein CutA [Verrucomicrobiaceae bacterium]